MIRGQVNSIWIHDVKIGKARAARNRTPININKIPNARRDLSLRLIIASFLSR
jgi:hypothetical protein